MLLDGLQDKSPMKRVFSMGKSNAMLAEFLNKDLTKFDK